MKRGFLLNGDSFSRQSNGPSPFGARPDGVGRGSQRAWGSQSSWIRQSPKIPKTPWVGIGNTATTPNATPTASTVVSTKSSSAPETAPANPYKGQPFIPINIGSPKACLSGNWYGQKPRSHQLSEENYVTWHDGGMPHNLKYTCAFVCPLTGEVFSSGTYGDETAYTVQADEAGVDVVWYKKKSLAEHGAAARAYDCFSYRHYFSTSTSSVRSGTSHPYLEPDRIEQLDPDHPAPTCPQMPPEVEQKVLRLQQQVRDRTEAMVGVDVVDDEDQGPSQIVLKPPPPPTGPPAAILQGWYSQKPRSHQLSKENYISWNDGGKQNDLHFTCIFVCPLTGEPFPSGTYGDETAYTVKTDDDTGVEIVWYKKKKLAEHGAAARAYDCFSYRQCRGTPIEPIRIGTSSNPDHHQPCLLPKLPHPLLEEQVSVLQQQARHRDGSTVTGSVEWQASMLSQPEAMYNAEYKQSRKRPAVVVELDDNGE